MQKCAHALRFLSVDAVYKAQSGHPGMPLGMADIATVLWQKFLNHHPLNPYWFNRDRFVLSNGHGSMLLYALLHLTGYALSLEDLKQFRQLHAKTPGHPECTVTPGVETTTGPLGQGLANAVGMAIAEKILAAQFNRPGYPLVDHRTYVFVGDGCLMEGLSHEAASLAGTLALGRLIVFYDDNGISIDGTVKPWFSEDVALRFKSYHWHVIEHVDGHDETAIEAAILAAQAETTRPSLIMCRTIIGYGSLVQNTAKVHGAPLTIEDMTQLREKFCWPYLPFEIPDKIYEVWDGTAKGRTSETAWLTLCQQYAQDYPTLYQEFLRRINGDLPEDWTMLTQDWISKLKTSPESMATRQASQRCIEFFLSIQPELLGGSADLTESNGTAVSKSIAISAEHWDGNYLHYGVREFAMSAVMNGLALHGGLIPFGGTFLVFSDYARHAIRLSALIEKRVIYVLTHDSIGLGEDGPTHQPVEHIAMLRMTPGLDVWRPADLLETSVAWQQAILKHEGPSALILSRQKLPVLSHEKTVIADIQKGAYIVFEPSDELEGIIIATGSEVHLACEVARYFESQGRAIRVISMPCMDRFEVSDKAYQCALLPESIRCRMAIEAGATSGWYRWVGLDGYVIGLDRFGVSAPYQEAYAYLGITVQRAIEVLNDLLIKLCGRK